MSLLFFPTSVTFLCHNLLPNSTAVGYVVEEKKSSITSGCRRFSGTMCSPRPFQLVWQNCCPDLAISLRRKQDKKKPDLRNRARNWSEWKSCDATFLIIRFFFLPLSWIAIFLERSRYILLCLSTASSLAAWASFLAAWASRFDETKSL